MSAPCVSVPRVKDTVKHINVTQSGLARPGTLRRMIGTPGRKNLARDSGILPTISVTLSLLDTDCWLTEGIVRNRSDQSSSCQLSRIAAGAVHRMANADEPNTSRRPLMNTRLPSSRASRTIVVQALGALPGDWVLFWSGMSRLIWDWVATDSANSHLLGSMPTMRSSSAIQSGADCPDVVRGPLRFINRYTMSSIQVIVIWPVVIVPGSNAIVSMRRSRSW